MVHFKVRDEFSDIDGPILPSVGIGDSNAERASTLQKELPLGENGSYRSEISSSP